MSKTLNLTIEGMKCGGCADTVRQRLKSASGVQDVQIDLESKSAAVTTDESTSQADLAAALAGTNYRVANK